MDVAQTALDLERDYLGRQPRTDEELAAELIPLLRRRGARVSSVLQYLRDGFDDQSPREAQAARLVKLAAQQAGSQAC